MCLINDDYHQHCAVFCIIMGNLIYFSEYSYYSNLLANLKIYTDWLPLGPSWIQSLGSHLAVQMKLDFPWWLFGVWGVCLSLPRSPWASVGVEEGPKENKEQLSRVFLSCSHCKPCVLPPPAVCRKRCCTGPILFLLSLPPCVREDIDSCTFGNQASDCSGESSYGSLLITPSPWSCRALNLQFSGFLLHSQ